MVAAACRVAQMSRETFYAWKRESVAFLEAWEELEEELSDIAKMTWAVGMKTDWRASQAWLERQDRLKKEAQADRLRALEGGEDADIILERGPDRFSKRSGDAGSED